LSDNEKIKRYKTESTEAMLNKLKSVNDFGTFDSNYKHEYVSASLSASIENIMNKKLLSKSDVIKRADLDRVYGYQIISGTRIPTREKLLQLGFGLCLDADGMQAMLKTTGYAPLYPKVKRDAAILFCFNKNYDLFDTQAMLQQAGLKLIGE